MSTLLVVDNMEHIKAMDIYLTKVIVNIVQNVENVNYKILNNMKNTYREQYDKLLLRMTKQKSVVSKVIKSCTTEDHLNSISDWIYNLWVTNYRMIKFSYDDLTLLSRPLWIGYKRELKFFCDHYFCNELVMEVKKQRSQINTSKS